MKYLLKHFSQGETIIYEGKAHRFYTYFYALLSFIGIIIGLYQFLNIPMIPGLLPHSKMINPLFIFSMLIGTFFLVIFIRRFLRLYSTEVFFTNKRLLYKTGFLSINTFEIRNNKIESVNIKQDLFERIIGAGSVIITGIGGKSQSIKNVYDPIELRNSIHKHTI